MMDAYYCTETVCLILSSLGLSFLCFFVQVLTIILPTRRAWMSVLNVAQSSVGTPEIP